MRQSVFTYRLRSGWWVVHFCKLAKLLLPTFLRKEALSSFVCALVFPIQQLHWDWLANRRQNLYTVQHNSQVCYLRKVLNDKFDNQLRRIRIDDGLGLDAIYIYTEGENRPVTIHTEDENSPLYLHQESAYAGTGVDFYVIVPSDLEYNELEMRKLIDFYRLASKRYEIAIG